MDTTATQTQYTPEPVLYLAFELDENHWKLGFTTGFGQPPRQRTIRARDLEALDREIHLAKQRFNLASSARVLSCYEAGREAFWLHRYLRSSSIDNLVVDSSSIEVPRRHRRRKTDRMDLGKLLKLLLRHDGGEDDVWSIVRVPGPADEDRRHLHRDLAALKKERTRHINRIKGLLATQGVRLSVGKNFLKELQSASLWDGSPLPSFLRARLEREYARKQFVESQIKQVEEERMQIMRQSEDPAVQMARDLLLIKSVGINSAWTFTMEFFAWRQFQNGREVGGLAGMAPTPYQSGDTAREQGMNKAGNVYVRALLIQVAWAWLRFQPHSKLSQWYQERYGEGSKRMRRIGIVALGRKILVALWRYLETGEIPEGAELKRLPF